MRYEKYLTQLSQEIKLKNYSYRTLQAYTQCVEYFLRSWIKTEYNGWQLQEVGVFEAQNCLPALNLTRSTKLHLTTEPPISCRCC